jgi:MFS family permease
MGASRGFNMLLVLRFCLGVAECLFLPAAIALIAEYHGPATRARAMSFISIGVNAGLVLGGTFAGFLADRFGWRFGFWVLGLAGVALALLAKPLLLSQPAAAEALPDVSATGAVSGAVPPVERSSFFEAMRYLVRVPSYYALLFESMLSGMGLWIFFSWLPLYFKDTLQHEPCGRGLRRDVHAADFRNPWNHRGRMALGSHLRERSPPANDAVRNILLGRRALPPAIPGAAGVHRRGRGDLDVLLSARTGSGQ